MTKNVGRGKRATLKEVSYLANVSPATVSRFLHGNLQVRLATEKAIRRAIAKTNYRPNQLAASLRTRRTKTIALVVPNIANPYSAALMQSIEGKLYEEDLSLMLLSTQEQVEKEVSYIDLLLDKRVEGVIFEARALYPRRPQSDSHIQRLIGEGIPVIFVHRENINTTTPCVVPDFDKGCYEAIEHLCKIGKRRLAYLIGQRDHGMSSRFLSACRDVSIRLGVETRPEDIIEGGYNFERSYTACKTRLANLNIDAVLALNDLMAIGAIHALMEEGRHVPTDVAVVGYGDSVFGRISTPQLTSVIDDLAKAGQVAVEILRDMLLGSQVTTVTLISPKGLAIRGSTICQDISRT